MTNTDDNIQINSSMPSGATIATDYHSATQTHFQVVKLNTGGDGNDALLSNTNPLPISYATSTGQPYVPVSGSTDGATPVQVQLTGGASVDIENITVAGGTITRITEGISADIRGVAVGVTMAVSTMGEANKVAVTGDVRLLNGSNSIGTVEVSGVTIPIGITVGRVTAGTSAVAVGTNTFQSGFRVTNFSSTSTIALGGDSNVGFTNGYLLNPRDSLFVESNNAAGVYVVRSSGGASADVRIIGS